MRDKQPSDDSMQDFLSLVKKAEAGLRGRHPGEWLDRLEAEHERLNTVLDWCLAHERSELGLEIAGAVWPFWLHRSHMQEGREWLAKMLATADTADASLGRARTLMGAGTLAFFQGDSEASAQQLQASLTLCERLDFAQGIAEAHSGLSRVAMAQGKPDEMRSHSHTALEVARRTANESGIAIALHHLAHAELMEGNLAEAERLYAENVETYRSMERDDLVVSELHNLGHVACLRGQHGRARSLFIESLERGEQAGNDANRPYNLIGLGRVAIALGKPDAAAVLLNAGLMILHAQGKVVVPLLRAAVEQAVTATKAALPATDHEAAAARGKALATDEAIQLADALQV